MFVIYPIYQLRNCYKLRLKGDKEMGGGVKIKMKINSTTIALPTHFLFQFNI